jgi:hypothetical protein
MTEAITTQGEMQQALQQLSRLYASLAALRSEVQSKNPRNFAVLAEGHVEGIRRLQRQLDKYVGVSPASRQVARKSRRRVAAKRGR